jgi:hypothetical protein
MGLPRARTGCPKRAPPGRRLRGGGAALLARGSSAVRNTAVGAVLPDPRGSTKTLWENRGKVATPFRTLSEKAPLHKVKSSRNLREPWSRGSKSSSANSALRRGREDSNPRLLVLETSSLRRFTALASQTFAPRDGCGTRCGTMRRLAHSIFVSPDSMRDQLPTRTERRATPVAADRCQPETAAAVQVTSQLGPCLAGATESH